MAETVADLTSELILEALARIGYHGEQLAFRHDFPWPFASTKYRRQVMHHLGEMYVALFDLEGIFRRPGAQMGLPPGLLIKIENPERYRPGLIDEERGA